MCVCVRPAPVTPPGSDDDSEDREYVQWLFEDEYAEAMSYTRGMTEPLAAAGRAGRLR